MSWLGATFGVVSAPMRVRGRGDAQRTARRSACRGEARGALSFQCQTLIRIPNGSLGGIHRVQLDWRAISLVYVANQRGGSFNTNTSRGDLVPDEGERSIPNQINSAPGPPISPSPFSSFFLIEHSAFDFDQDAVRSPRRPAGGRPPWRPGPQAQRLLPGRPRRFHARSVVDHDRGARDTS